MRERTLLFIVALVFLAACQPQAVVPTLAPTALVPTATPEEVTEAPPPTALPRATLPPTWTPEPQVAPTLLPTSESADNSAAPQQLSPVVAPTLPEACNVFEPDPNRNTRTYKSGEDPQVYWIPVEGAEYYSVSLTDEDGEIIFTDYTADSGFVFSADLIEDGNLYGWEAYPINALGQQMCLVRGAELFPEFLN